jgi:hypothetical protein
MCETDGPSDAERRSAIEVELRRVEESATYSSQGQFEQMKQWRVFNLVFGTIASVLAAASGATVLASSSGHVVAGILALVAAGFGAVLTTVNASERMNQAAAAANAYLAIQTGARQLRLIDLPVLAVDDARAALAELTARQDEQNKTAEPINRRARRKAQKNIDAGSQTYAVDQTNTPDR